MAHQGYGFCEFLTEEDAEYACKIMNQIKLWGKPIRVNKVRSFRPLSVEDPSKPLSPPAPVCSAGPHLTSSPARLGIIRQKATRCRRKPFHR